jgi:hypothetical protein
MGQFGFFDSDRRLAAITAKRDPLEMIARVVPFESFRAEIEAAVLTSVSEKKSPAGRKPIDVMVMFRMVVLQSLYCSQNSPGGRIVRTIGIARAKAKIGLQNLNRNCCPAPQNRQRASRRGPLPLSLSAA